MSKNILQSRTFWLNVLGIAVIVAKVIPPEYGGPALAIANIGVRMLTNQPVTVLPQ